MNKTSSFNGSHEPHTVSYPNIGHDVYKEHCPHCHGYGHTHAENGEEVRCSKCGGSGKENVYEGNVFKIYWDVPVYTNDNITITFK